MVINIENPESGITVALSMHAFVSDLSQADSVLRVKKALPVPVLADYSPGELVGTDEHYLSLAENVLVRIFATGPNSASIFVQAPRSSSSLNGRVIAILRTVRDFREATIEEPKKKKKQAKGRGTNLVQHQVEDMLALTDFQGKVALCDEPKRELHGAFFNRVDVIKDVLNQLAAAALTMAKGPLGMDVSTFFTSKLGMKGFRAHLSDTQRLKFKKDYIGTYKGESHLGEWHVTFFDGPNVLSIHFVYSTKHQAILITRIGDHGRTNQDPK